MGVGWGGGVRRNGCLPSSSDKKTNKKLSQEMDLEEGGNTSFVMHYVNAPVQSTVLTPESSPRFDV